MIDHDRLRMFRYFARLYEKYRLPVYPIVLFSYVAPVREALLDFSTLVDLTAWFEQHARMEDAL